MARKPKTPAEQVAYIVPTGGTDDEVMKLCADNVGGWGTLRAEQQADMVRLMREYNARPSVPEMAIKRNEDGGCTIGTGEGANVTLNALRLTKTFASKSRPFVDGMVGDLATYHNRANKAGASSDNVSASLAFVHGAQVQDSVQAALATQMAATHDAAMRSLTAMAAQNTVQGVELYSNTSTKLMKVFARQAEVLAKLQRGGEQVIRHVHVDNRGGQAVFAEQVVTGGVSRNGANQPYATGSAGVGPAMLCQDTLGRGVPIPGDQEQEAMPDAWRQGKRRAKG